MPCIAQKQVNDREGAVRLHPPMAIQQYNRVLSIQEAIQ
jgi:hypothetical protein